METVNYDILMLLSQLLAQSEDFGGVASMTRTCRFLHMECASLLLTPRHIGLPGEGPIESFCRFMLADKRRRYPLLSKCHSLGFITFVPLPEPISDLLAETLRCVTTFPGCVRFIGFERLMLSSRRILPALAALTWIHRLDINSRGSEMIPGKRFYAKFLKALQAPLNAVKVSVPFSGEKHYHVSYDRELDPLWLFSSLSSTLESIVLIGDVMVEACSMTPVYPRLTHLTVSKDCMPVVRPYIKAFPSLRVLHFNYAHFTWADTFLPRHSLPTATLRNKASEELRRDNRADQLAHGSWTGMKYFMAMTLDAYMAGLTCQIPSLHLIAWGGTSEGEISAICAVVADARPSLFRLALRPPHIGYIPALFSQRSDLFKSLSSLELRVDLTTVPFDLKSYFDEVGATLQELRIVSLQLEFKCMGQYTVMNVSDPPYCDVPLDEVTARCWTLEALSSEDLEGRLRYFLEKVPTLRQVTIAYGRCRVGIPHRFITMDLNNMPHTVDRRGRPTDKYWMDGY